MSYYTRQQKVKDISNTTIDENIGTKLQHWGSNLDDINSINGLANPSRALVIDSSTGKIIPSSLSLGTAAYKNVGVGIGNVVSVGSDGKIDETLLPDGYNIPNLWGNIKLTSSMGVILGDSLIQPNQASQELKLVAGENITLVGDNTSKTIRFETSETNNWFYISDGVNNIAPTISSDTLTINTDNNLSVETLDKAISFSYTGTQYSQINADVGTMSASSTNDTFSILGDDVIETNIIGSIINISYKATQWSTFVVDGYNYNIIGETDTATYNAENHEDQINITAGVGIAMETDIDTKSIVIRSAYLERATTIEGLDGDNIDGGDYNEQYDGYTYNGGTYYAYDGGSY